MDVEFQLSAERVLSLRAGMRQDSANLFFQLVSSRYEHASLVLTSNLAFSRWGEVFSDATVASAMIDRIVHHAEVLNLTGSSYRLRNKTRTQLQAQ